MNLKHFINTDVHDCLICALRPLIFLGFSVTYIAKAQCPHKENVKKPSFQLNSYINFTFVIYNSLMFIGFILTIIACKESAFQHAVTAIKFINTVILTMSIFVKNRQFMRYANGLVTIIEKRKIFGIETILSRAVTTRFRLLILGALCTCILYLLVVLYDSIRSDLSIQNILRSVGITVMYMNTVNILSNIIVTVLVYTITLRICYATIEETLNNALFHYDDTRLVTTVALQQKIQYFQRFYLAVCQNYNNHVFAFGNVLYYIEQFIFSILLGVHFYLYISYEDEDGMEISWSEKMCIIIDNCFMWGGTLIYCIVAYRLTIKREDLLSFLYKYPISKLNAGEAAQVEILITAIIIKKPELVAADLFTIGINLLSSLSGTVITYTLVAMQFHSYSI